MTTTTRMTKAEKRQQQVYDAEKDICNAQSILQELLDAVDEELLTAKQGTTRYDQLQQQVHDLDEAIGKLDGIEYPQFTS